MIKSLKVTSYKVTACCSIRQNKYCCQIKIAVLRLIFILLIHVTDTQRDVTRIGNHYCSIYGIKIESAVFRM